MLKTTLTAIIATALATGTAQAMEFQRVPLPAAANNGAIITMQGEILAGDADKFSKFLQTLQSTDRIAVFAMDSPGGAISEAAKIGAIIAKSGAATVLPANVTCASACFWVFAAGQHRVMVSNAQLGVHGASNKTGAEASDSTVAMARFGHDIGIPDAIIVKLVTTPPDKMAWLTPRDLTEMGVELLSPSAARTAALLPASTPPTLPAPAMPPVFNPATPAMPAGDAATQAFAEGRTDRQAFESWIASLPEGSKTKDGALYWASVRSTPKAAVGCVGPGYTGTPEQQEWANGCQTAKAKLDPIDVRRTHEPDYKAGWNSASREISGPQSRTS
jgi:hypothetical protein